MAKQWGWLLAAGIAYIAVGILALLIPIASTIGLTFALAGILLASGIIQLVQSVKLRHKKGKAMRLFQAVLALAVAALIFWIPGIGMLGITLMLSFYFLTSSVLQWIFTTNLPIAEENNGRIWGYVGSMASFALGVYILVSLPISALWLPGTLLGIELLFTGGALMGLAFTVKAEKSVTNDNQKAAHGLPHYT